MIRCRHQKVRTEELLHSRPKVAGELRISIRNDGLRKTMEPINVVIIKSGNLLSCDVFRGGDEVYHFGHSTANDVESIELVAGVVLRGREVHEIHRNNRPRPLRDRKRFGKSLASRRSGLVDLTVVTSVYSIDDIGDESLPVEVMIYRRESLLVTEVTEGLVNMVDQDVPQSFLPAMDRNLDIRDAESNAARRAVLVQKTARRV